MATSSLSFEETLQAARIRSTKQVQQATLPTQQQSQLNPSQQPLANKLWLKEFIKSQGYELSSLALRKKK